MDGTSGLVGFLLSFVLLCWYAALLCKWIKSSLSTTAAKHAVKKFFQGALAFSVKKQVTDPSEDELWQLVTQCKKQWAHTAIKYSLHVLAPGVVLTLGIRRDFMFLAPFAFCLVFMTCPKLITARALAAAYAFMTATWMFAALMIRDAAHLHESNPVLIMMRVISGVCLFNPFFCGICNVLVMSVHIVSWYLNVLDEGNSQDVLLYVCAVEVWVTASLLVLFAGTYHHMWAVTQQILHIKTTSRSEVLAARSLLCGLCDAVVALGPDLSISSRAPKLANMLRMQHAANALEGTPLLSLISESDQARFPDYVERVLVHTGTDTDPEPAQALNVHFHTSDNVAVQVQLFHSRFTAFDNKICHLLGICEHGYLGTDPTDTSSNKCRHHPPEHGSSGSFEGMSESTMRDNSSMSDLSKKSGNSSLGGRTVDLSFTSCRFTLNQCHSAAPVLDASLIGHDGLLQRITGWDSTRAWLQDFMNAVLRPIKAESWPQKAGPPHSLKVSLALSAYCRTPSDVLSSAPKHNSSNSTGGAPPNHMGIGRVNLKNKRAFCGNRHSQDRNLLLSVVPTVLEESPQDGGKGNTPTFLSL